MTASAEPPEDYRPCVGVALFNLTGRVFMGRRIGATGLYSWQMPQGGIDPGEAPLDAARRELREETGIADIALLAEAPLWLSYDLPPETRKNTWRGRFRGQAQKWFAFRFEGKDSEIDLSDVAKAHKAEFDAWRWEHLANAPSLIIPFKRPVYEAMVDVFAGFSNVK